jgi:tetratricopeptide (TPR) repeat protein
MEVVVRTRLIELFASHGEIDRALEHYVLLGDSYYQLAQLDRARDKFNEAMRLAPRGSPQRRWEVRLLHRIGDIDAQQVNWKQAISVYERIRDLAPDDEKARLTLMDLYNRFQQPARALAELDGLVQTYRESGKTQKALTVLEQVVQERPDDITLRTRLVQAYMDAQDMEGARVQLDTLGELQIQAGRLAAAIKTIQTIINLNPPNVEGYQQLLQELKSSQAGS